MNSFEVISGIGVGSRKTHFDKTIGQCWVVEMENDAHGNDVNRQINKSTYETKRRDRQKYELDGQVKLGLGQVEK